MSAPDYSQTFCYTFATRLGCTGWTRVYSQDSAPYLSSPNGQEKSSWTALRRLLIRRSLLAGSLTSHCFPTAPSRTAKLERLDRFPLPNVGPTVIVQVQRRLTVAEDGCDGPVRLAGVEHRRRDEMAKMEQSDR